jgi:hypothetical protein
MTKCSLLGAALIFGLLVSNAAPAQARDDTGLTGWRPWWDWPLAWNFRPPYHHPNRCLVWDGYQWVNLCYRGRRYFSPTWMRFHR